MESAQAFSSPSSFEVISTYRSC